MTGVKCRATSTSTSTDNYDNKYGKNYQKHTNIMTFQKRKKNNIRYRPPLFWTMPESKLFCSSDVFPKVVRGGKGSQVTNKTD